MYEEIKIPFSQMAMASYYAGVHLKDLVDFQLFRNIDIHPDDEILNIKEEVLPYPRSFPVKLVNEKMYVIPDGLMIKEEFKCLVVAVLHKFGKELSKYNDIDYYLNAVENRIFTTAQAEETLKAALVKVRKGILPFSWGRFAKSAIQGGFTFEKLSENTCKIIWGKPFDVGNDVEGYVNYGGVGFVVNKAYTIVETIVYLKNGFEINSKWFPHNLLPHLSVDNVFCLGDNNDLMDKAKDNSLNDLFIQLLKVGMFNYNPESPYSVISVIRNKLLSLQRLWDMNDKEFRESKKYKICNVCFNSFYSVNEKTHCISPTCRNNPNAILKCKYCGEQLISEISEVSQSIEWSCSNPICIEHKDYEPVTLKCIKCGSDLSNNKCTSTICNLYDIRQSNNGLYIIKKVDGKYQVEWAGFMVCPDCGGLLRSTSMGSYCIKPDCAKYKVFVTNGNSVPYHNKKIKSLSDGQTNVCPECGRNLVIRLEGGSSIHYEYCINKKCDLYDCNLYEKTLDHFTEKSNVMTPHLKVYMTGKIQIQIEKEYPYLLKYIDTYHYFETLIDHIPPEKLIDTANFSLLYADLRLGNIHSVVQGVLNMVGVKSEHMIYIRDHIYRNYSIDGYLFNQILRRILNLSGLPDDICSPTLSINHLLSEYAQSEDDKKAKEKKIEYLLLVLAYVMPDDGKLQEKMDMELYSLLSNFRVASYLFNWKVMFTNGHEPLGHVLLKDTKFLEVLNEIKIRKELLCPSQISQDN